MATENPTPTPAADPVAQTPPLPQSITPPDPSPGPALAPLSPSPAPAAPISTPAPEHPSIREMLKNLGVAHADRYPDDTAALRDLTHRAREAEQLRELARVGQQVYPQLSEFQKWQAEQEKARQAAESEKARWWNPPEYDPRWNQLIEQDPQTGELKPRAGAPHNIVEKYRAAQEHSRNFLEKFAFDPIGSIQPGIEEIARGLVERTVQEHMGQMHERLMAKDIIQQNYAWMYQQDAAGQSVMTPYGQVYAQTLHSLDQRGVRDITLQNEVARDKAMLVLLADQVKQLQAAQARPATPQLTPTPPVPPANPVEAQDQANAAFTRQRTRGRRPAQTNPATITDTPIPEGKSALRQAILDELERNGYPAGSKLVAV